MRTNRRPNKISRIAGLLFVCLAPLVFTMPAIGADTNSPSPVNVLIQQKPGDLLDGFKRAVCYSGFRHGQHPDRGQGAINPGDKEILEDLQLLQQNGFGLIRLYDAQENSAAVLRLIQANKLKLKVLLGAWLDAEVSNPNCPWRKEPIAQDVLDANKLKNRREIEQAIRLANQYSNIVVAVSVGNECLVDWNDHMVPVDSVIGYVRKVKQSIHQPVTVCDNYNWWSHNGADLAKELDFVSVHTYPIWEGKDIDEAMPFTIANLQVVRNALPHSRIVITEAGWATVASEFGPRASGEKQARYYHDLFAWMDKMNITTFFFEAFDEDWKGDPNNMLGAEKHWGLFTVDRDSKEAMRR
jgi:exo-beta-1,3-glucanase (GH17 family)